jgi:hypothetical protein
MVLKVEKKNFVANYTIFFQIGFPSIFPDRGQNFLLPGNILASGSTALDHCTILSFVPFIVHHCTIVRIYIYIERERINNTWVRGNTRFISSVEHDISQVSAANE